jgi:hypothetical protein
LISSWILGESTLLCPNSAALEILGVHLSSTETQLFYAVVGKAPGQFFLEHTVQITDTMGNAYPIQKVIALETLDNLVLGIMAFDPRQAGVGELYLEIVEAADTPEGQKVLLAEFDGPAADDRLDLTTSIRREGGMVTPDYRVEMFLWPSPGAAGHEPSSSTFSVTPTPVQMEAWLEAADEVTVLDEFSFRIENRQTGQTRSLNIQVLGDGNVIRSADNQAAMLAPVLFSASSPTSVPYP